MTEILLKRIASHLSIQWWITLILKSKLSIPQPDCTYINIVYVHGMCRYMHGQVTPISRYYCYIIIMEFLCFFTIVFIIVFKLFLFFELCISYKRGKNLIM